MKIFADFVVLSQTVKILTSKYLSKYTFNLRNLFSLQKFYPRIRKSAWLNSKIFTLEKFRLYGKCWSSLKSSQVDNILSTLLTTSKCICPITQVKNNKHKHVCMATIASLVYIACDVYCLYTVYAYLCM